MKKKILAGDIGGTNCRMTLCDYPADHLAVCETKIFSSQEHPSLETILEIFLDDRRYEVVAACFGVPGPVIDGQVRATNLPWTMSQEVLKNLLKCEKTFLMNDLAATIAGARQLDDSQKTLLHPGKNPINHHHSSTIAIVAPGTGLGQAALINNTVVPSEGGHVDFSPRSDRELRLMEFLLKYLNCYRISVERLVSGPGLENIFAFLMHSEGKKPNQETIKRLESEDHAAVIGEIGISGSDPVCKEAIEWFTSILAQHCSNVVLTYMSTGGLYLGGGIPAKILPLLKSELFLSTMFKKGRLSPMVEATPIYAITEKYAGLFGALQVAKNSLEQP